MVPFNERHSEEVREIISRPPHWVAGSGMSMMFGLLLLAATGCWFIQSPDKVTVPITLTSIDPPRKAVVPQNGRITKLLVSDGASVVQGEMLAFCESTASHRDVLQLDRHLLHTQNLATRGQWEAIGRTRLNSYLQLGELQSDFQRFSQALSEMESSVSQGFYAQKKALMEKDLWNLKEQEKVTLELLEVQKRDYALALDEADMQEKLYHNKAISLLEYKREKSKLLAKELPLKNLGNSLIQNRTAQTGKQKEILEFDNAVHQQKNTFVQTLHNLKASVDAWKKRYILTAPVKGRVSFSEPWYEQQYFSAGQEFATIGPVGDPVQGIVKIPQGNFGKIQEGQPILIKLDGYPYREYGILTGKLSRITTTPGPDSLYWAYVSLPAQLKTRYGRALNFKNGMKGTAEIITRNRRVLDRIISPFRDGQ